MQEYLSNNLMSTKEGIEEHDFCSNRRQRLEQKNLIYRETALGRAFGSALPLHQIKSSFFLCVSVTPE